MAVIKCKMCGGELTLTEGSPLAQCEYCGSLQTVPNTDNEKKLTQFARANRLRFNCEFDKASGVYESIVADYPEEAEAYWGLVLCKYGIEYVDDPATKKKVPTCHRSSFQSVVEDTDFEQALENADPVARKVYREEAKQIEELRKGILEVSSKADPYDIFICYKETGEDGERTLDSVLAQDLYDALVEKGYRVFFSRITLEDKLGQEYEPYIFAALNSAKVMLAIGTDYEYYNAVWVRNEWSRYLKLMAEDHSKHLIPCYKGIDAYDMPKEFAKLQAQDLSKMGATQDILRGIEKLIKAATAESAAPKSAEIGQLLALGNEALEKKEWGIASSRFDLALTVDPMCQDALLGKLMAEYKCDRREQLAKGKKRLSKNNNYKLLMDCADAQLKQELEGYCKKTLVRHKLRMTALAVLAMCVLAAAITWAEISYRSVLNSFYAGGISAKSMYEEVKLIPWRVDSCTRYLLTKELSDVYPNAKVKTELKIPKGVTVIGENLFEDFEDIKIVIIPDGVTTIGACAFKKCHSLETVILPDSVTIIGDLAFSNCKSLTNISMSESLVAIYGRAFLNCESLTSITIPESVERIGYCAFLGCTNMKEVTIKGTNIMECSARAFGNSPVTDVYFSGSEEEARLSKWDNDLVLQKATWHYTN